MATKVVQEMLKRNSVFAQTYKASPKLQVTPGTVPETGTGALLLSCLDPRVNPEKILGIEPSMRVGVIRNAGGRVMDELRSIAVIQTMSNPGTIIVMHHTDCGMTHMLDEYTRAALIDIAPDHKETIESTKYGEIRGSIEESVKEDIELLRNSPFLRKGVQLVGLKYDIETGTVTLVE